MGGQDLALLRRMVRGVIREGALSLVAKSFYHAFKGPKSGWRGRARAALAAMKTVAQSMAELKLTEAPDLDDMEPAPWPPSGQEIAKLVDPKGGAEVVLTLSAKGEVYLDGAGADGASIDVTLGKGDDGEAVEAALKTAFGGGKF